MLWKNIERILTEKKLTVYKLCLLAGVGTAQIYSLRDGKVKDLHFETVKKIAKALDVSLDELAKS
ncbi:TPA: helix-turn-helix transcriptional regulator [Streptococcus suis]|nr:helix-turn-helix transcriptional regulator [Streptococcus suis]